MCSAKRSHSTCHDCNDDGDDDGDNYCDGDDISGDDDDIYDLLLL